LRKIINLAANSENVICGEEEEGKKDSDEIKE